MNPGDSTYLGALEKAKAFYGDGNALTQAVTIAISTYSKKLTKLDVAEK